jgi:hypothetical protein
VLDIVVHQNIRVSDVIVSDILDSDYLPIVFHILVHVKVRNILEPFEKFRLGTVSKPRWETKIGNTEVTPQAIWPIVKSLLKRAGPRPPTAIHGGASGLKFHPYKKAKAIADCLEIQFTPHDMCDKNHEQQVDIRLDAVLDTIPNSPS